MLYFSADCNLASEMIAALREMHRVGSNGTFDVVVQLDGRHPSRLFELVNAAGPRSKLGDLPHNILSTSSKPIENTAPSKQVRLRNFIYEIIRDHQAEHYMLALSGHGKGTVGGFLQGESPSSWLGVSLVELHNIFQEVKDAFAKDGWPTRSFAGKERIDILGLDTCLGSMAEVAYEFRGDVDLMVGTEAFTPNRGWPYDKLLQTILNADDPAEGSQERSSANPAGLLFDISPKSLAKKLVRHYIKYYFDFSLVDVSTDQAALDLSRITTFGPKLRGLSECLKRGLAKPSTRDAIVLAHWEAQSYKNDEYTDLWDFCSLLGERSRAIDGELSEACEKVRNAIEEVVLLCCYAGPKFQHSHGLSVFFPWTEIKDAEGINEFEHYRKFSFAEATMWDEFLCAYIENTRREPRCTLNSIQKRRKMTNPNRPNEHNESMNVAVKGAPPEDKFAPPEDRENSPGDRENFPGDRETAPIDRYAPPEDKFDSEGDARFGQAIKGGGIKNGPVEWYPCDGLEDDEQGNDVAMHSPNPVAEGASVRDPEVGAGDKDREVSSVTGDRYDDATRSDGQLTVRDGLFTVKVGVPESDRSAPPEDRSNPPENRDGVFTVKDGQFTVE